VTISYLESGKLANVRLGTMRALVRALEAAGVEFTEGGVRLAQGLPSAPRPSAPRRRRPAIAKPDTASQARISKKTGLPVRAYRRRS
jgi:hypothetical protein